MSVFLLALLGAAVAAIGLYCESALIAYAVPLRSGSGSEATNHQTSGE